MVSKCSILPREWRQVYNQLHGSQRQNEVRRGLHTAVRSGTPSTFETEHSARFCLAQRPCLCSAAEMLSAVLCVPFGSLRLDQPRNSATPTHALLDVRIIPKVRRAVQEKKGARQNLHTRKLKVISVGYRKVFRPLLQVLPGCNEANCATSTLIKAQFKPRLNSSLFRKIRTAN